MKKSFFLVIMGHMKKERKYGIRCVPERKGCFMIEKARKVGLVSLFLFLIFIPWLLSLAGIHLGNGLGGVTVAVPEPELSVKSVLEGSWQESVEEWTKSELSVREPLIRMGNQVVFSLFDGSANQYATIGKENVIFEDVYLEAQLQYDQVSEEEIEILAGKLEELNRQLEANGQHLVIFVTPMKTLYWEEYAPDVWEWFSPERTVSPYEKLKGAIEETSLTYYDSVPFIQQLLEQGVTCWYKTGNHWSEWSAMLVAQDLSDFLEETYGYDFPEWEVSGVPVDTPLDWDQDVFKSLNLLIGPYDEQYYAPEVSEREAGSAVPVVFSQGGSFQHQSVLPMLRYAGNRFTYLENMEYVCGNGQEEQKGTFSAFEDLEAVNTVREADLVILEVNLESIDRMSFGFIDYLLDSGILEQ